MHHRSTPPIAPTLVALLAWLLVAKIAKAQPEDEKDGAVAPPALSMRYAPERAKVAPVVDGDLSDPVWATAVADTRFFSANSVPYGRATAHPTSVKIVYDARFLYLAFRCDYEKPGDVDDAVSQDESDLLDASEYVAVYVDGKRDRANSKAFLLSRTGHRADLDRAGNGSIENLDWQGLWRSATTRDAHGWSAEIAIPWSTVGVSAHDAPFDVGIELERRIPLVQERAVWALYPPDAAVPPSWFGTLSGLTDVAPHLRLYFQPFVSGLAQTPGRPLPRLRDFTRASDVASGYAGLYARYRPNDSLQIDGTFNPDFSQAAPDQALTNLDRFELARPEVRPFFAEDLTRFEVGPEDESNQLGRAFYSRRIGLRETATGVEEVPILFGGKSVVRAGSTEIAAMNVGTAGTGKRISLDEDVSVLRVNELLPHGSRVGAIGLFKRSDAGEYASGGADVRVAFFDEHLRVSGFALGSSTTNAKSGVLGGGGIFWRSRELKLFGSYQENTPTYDPALGFFPELGYRNFSAGVHYAPTVNSDLVQRIDIGAEFANASSIRDDALLYSRSRAGLTADLQNGGRLAFSARMNTEGVLQEFAIADGRIPVPVGRYATKVVDIIVSTPPRRIVTVDLGYSEGDLFGGYTRSPKATIGVNFGRFNASAAWAFYFLSGVGGEHLAGGSLQGKLVYDYTPLARSQLIVQGNSVDGNAAMQLLNSYRFGLLSQIALVATRQATTLSGWFDAADTRAILSFAYGFSLI